MIVYCYNATTSGTRVKLRCIDHDTQTPLVVTVTTPGYQLVPYDPELSHLAVMIGTRHMIVLGDEYSDGTTIPAHMGLAMHRDIDYTGAWLQLTQHHGTAPVLYCTYDDIITVHMHAATPTLTMYWDIETMSTVVGDYPDHQRPGDAVCIITFSQGHSTTQDTVAVRTYMLQTVAQRMSTLPANTVVYDDELSMITDFLNAMKQYTHTVSFNGMGYDMDYLIHRELLLSGNVGNHSRIPKLRRTYHHRKAGWRSGLTAKQPEIVHIDLLPIVQTLMPDLPSHKLNLVCGLILGEHKDDVDFHVVNGIFATPLQQLTQAQRDTVTQFVNYAIKDTALLVRLWQWAQPHCQALCSGVYSAYAITENINQLYECVSWLVSTQYYPRDAVPWNQKWPAKRDGMCPQVYYYTLAPWYRLHYRTLLEQWEWLQRADRSDVLAVLCGICLGAPKLSSTTVITTGSTGALSSGTFDGMTAYGMFDKVLCYQGQWVVTTGGSYYVKSPLRSPLLELKPLVEQLAKTGTSHEMLFNMNGYSHELADIWYNTITTVLQ